MKVLGNAVMVIGVVALMGGIMLAQRDYQHDWSAGQLIPQTSMTEVDFASGAYQVDTAMVAMK
jgi:hypothetical protein